MADLKENQMAARTAAKVRCLDASGNSGIITLQNLLSYLFGTVNKAVIEEDWNEIDTGGKYAVSGFSGSNAPNTYAYGMLLVAISGSFTYQIYIPHIGNTVSNKIAIRARYQGNWSNWYYINMTLS